ncbi:hypothetical protein FOA52_000309 [Chlamydomonas sp. UWO 241]|nr:hypothetical protein FOA52_000309 [Chlamydomonas sp. UWO 241]
MGGKKGPPQMGNQGMEAMEDEPRGKSAMPPQCPRCELTKAQFTRTIQNYQKAYRKKVEGLKTELKSTRVANTRLTKQVKSLKSLTRVHVPSIALGAAVCALFMKLWSRRGGRGGSKTAVGEEAAVVEVAEPGTPEEAEH